MNQTKKLGIAMSGGGAQAMVYLGFMRVLWDAGVKIDYLVGHSGGATILCFLASGMSDQEIINEYKGISIRKFLNFNPLKNKSILDPRKVYKYLSKISQGKLIEDLPFKAGIALSDVTDLDNPFPVVKTEGKLAKYAAASLSIPPLMPSFHESERIFLDGGYTTLYSAKFLREQKMDKIIGLFPDALKNTKLPFGVSGIVRMVKAIMSHRELLERALYPIDLEVRRFTTETGLFDYKKADFMYDIGRKRAEKHLSEIKALIE